MAPPPGQERQVALARRALATPPDQAGFDASGPTEKERESFANVLRLRREEPSSPLLVALQRKLDELEAVRVTFLPAKMMITTRNGTDMTGYQVEENLGERLVILEEGSAPLERRRKILAFDGNDRMVVTTGATRIPMVRVPAGTVPAPTEVPSSPSPAANTPSSSPKVPASGDAELDTCVTSYYACIDRMPASARPSLEGVLAQTRRIFTEAAHDPSKRASALASCKQALSLGRSTFCP